LQGLTTVTSVMHSGYLQNGQKFASTCQFICQLENLLTIIVVFCKCELA
jgi:hypothetical protein